MLFFTLPFMAVKWGKNEQNGDYIKEKYFLTQKNR